MRISDKYRICEIMGAVYMVPVDDEKLDMDRMEKIVGSGADILKEIAAGTATMPDLIKKLCEQYELQGEEKIRAENVIAGFIQVCIEKGMVWEEENSSACEKS